MAEAAKERETHERMVEDFQMLLDQKSKAQTDRMVRLCTLTHGLSRLTHGLKDTLRGFKFVHIK